MVNCHAALATKGRPVIARRSLPKQSVGRGRDEDRLLRARRNGGLSQ
jgi:hypothetical protein